jgi:hypothetical protein
MKTLYLLRIQQQQTNGIVVNTIVVLTCVPLAQKQAGNGKTLGYIQNPLFWRK